MIGLNIEKPSIAAPTAASSKPKNPAIFFMIHLIASSSIIPRSRNPPKKFLSASPNPSQIAANPVCFDSVNPVQKSNTAIMICIQKKSFPNILPTDLKKANTPFFAALIAPNVLDNHVGNLIPPLPEKKLLMFFHSLPMSPAANHPLTDL